MTVFRKDCEPKDFSVESARTLVNKLMIIAPFVLMSSIALKARTTLPDFEFVACNKAENHEIENYRDVVAATEEACPVGQLLDLGQARKLAKMWIDGAQSGKLQSLDSVAFEDTMRDGVKAEILHANMLIAESLNEYARDEIKQGKFDLAAKDTVLAAKALDVTKFSDFASLSACAMVQRRSLESVTLLLPKVSPSVRDMLYAQVAGMKSNETVLGRLAMRERQLFLQYQLRIGMDLAEVKKSEEEVSRREVSGVGSLMETVREIKKSYEANRDTDASVLMTDLRLGFLAALDTDKRITQIESSRINPVTL